jgi:tRNA (guanine26-N2/guanine27-N2)-dimethyltransferase
LPHYWGRLDELMSGPSEIPFKTKMVVEGAAKLLVPLFEEMPASSKMPAFYNPASKASRDLAVLAVNAYFRGAGCRFFAEPLAGAGARAVRLLLETNVAREGVAGDINPWAVALSRINASLNGLSERLRVEHSDANLLLARLALEGRACYVDIDPFGSPIRFLESALRATERNGLLGVSATDLAALSGSSRRTAYWRYGLTLSKTVFFKEVAIRALAGVVVRASSRLGLAATPVVSVAYRHFVRVFFRVERGKSKAYAASRMTGHLAHCRSCLNTMKLERLEDWSRSCSICGHENVPLGPIWLGPLTDGAIIQRILTSELASDDTYSEVLSLIRRLDRELQDIPWSYPISELSRRAKTSPPRPGEILEKLVEIGYRASATHYDPSSIKTDAPVTILTRLVAEHRSK